MIFQSNFFLFSFAQCTIWSYSFVYAEHYSHVSAIKFGILQMIIPMLIFFAKPTVCQVADANQAHKKLLVFQQISFLLSYSSLILVAFIKDPNDTSWDNSAWVIIGFLMTIGSVSNACILTLNDALASNYARKHNVSYGSLRKFSNIGWACGACVCMVLSGKSSLPFRVPSLIVMATAMIANISLVIFWPYDEDFEMFHDGTTINDRKMSIVGPKTLAYIASKKPRLSISKDILERIKTGRSKSMGALPRIDIQDPITLKHDDNNKQDIEPKREYSSLECQFILLKYIATAHKSLIKFLLLFVAFGCVQGIIWNYSFTYIKQDVERRYGNTEKFEFLSNICMIGQSLGETPTNMLAGALVPRFGSNKLLSFAFIVLGIKVFYYASILPYVSEYSLILGEALSGPSLALYFIVSVEVGSHYALMVTEFIPKLKERGIVRNRAHEEELEGCLRATMIGLASGSMEGLGVGIGAMVGGSLSEAIGYENLWKSCAVAMVAIGYLNLIWTTRGKIARCSSKKDKKDEQPTIELPSIMIK